MIGCPIQGKDLVIVKMCFPISIYMDKISLHKYAKLISQVMLESIKLTINSSHHNHTF